jgi:hypothetical protein
MPFRTSRTHRKVYEVLRDLHFSKHNSRLFDSSYIAANPYQEKLLYPGMVVAVDSATSKYVPYSVGASYGTGSDTAVGLLVEPHDVTMGDKIVAPVWHAVVKESYCFLYGSALGSVTSGVKTALANIQWV